MKNWQKIAVWSIGGLFVLCVACGILGALVPESENGETIAEVDATDVPEATEAPTEEPTDVPEPTPTLEPEAAVRQAITDALRDSNRDVERVSEISLTLDEPPQIYVLWAINDNLTEEMLKGGAKLDVTNMLEAIAESGFEYDSVLVEGTFSLIDQFGNTSEDKVVRALYQRETVDRINFDRFLHDDVYAIADDTAIHTLFQD